MSTAQVPPLDDAGRAAPVRPGTTCRPAASARSSGMLTLSLFAERSWQHLATFSGCMLSFIRIFGTAWLVFGCIGPMFANKRSHFGSRNRGWVPRMSGPDAHAQERLRHLENEVARLREQLRKKRDRKVFRQQIAFCTLLGLVWICTHILVQQQRLDRLFTSAQALLRPQAASPSASPVVELFSLARSVSDAGSNVLGMLSSAAGGAAGPQPPRRRRRRRVENFGTKRNEPSWRAQRAFRFLC